MKVKHTEEKGSPDDWDAQVKKQDFDREFDVFDGNEQEEEDD